jgi:S-formylglutathione hydrolase FrmB
MMRGRTYRVLFGDTAGGLAITAAQDLVTIIGATGKLVFIKKRWIGAVNTTIPTAQMIQLRERLLPATVTTTGGTTPTIYKTDPGDAAASFTALVTNTTKATTSGTAIELFATGEHIYNGYDDEASFFTPVGPSEAYVFELLSTVTGTCNFSGGVEVEEFGG